MDFFVRTFLKNPIGLIVLGVAVAILLGATGGFPMVIIGTIIAGIGILWLVLRNKGLRKIIAAHSPLYYEIIDALKKSGYEIYESEHKKDLIQSRVSLNGKELGMVFLVAPPPSGKYEHFKGVVKVCERNFERDCAENPKTAPSIPYFCWPDDSLIGAFSFVSAKSTDDNHAEKQEWMSKMINIFQEKL
uniref:Uncharacterized protein n=1 Tax=uncultured bacterium contig00032 TaxID=1181521 RepID=A0A806KFY3_9BACT|nr:hypothetical protein [uncultured bacterium contig00032]